jgi:hypothetical protein
MSNFVLYESASGFALFERVASEEVGQELEAVQQAITDLARFSKIVKLKAFLPFTTAEQALENINAISEGFAFFFLFVPLLSLVPCGLCWLASVLLTPLLIFSLLFFVLDLPLFFLFFVFSPFPFLSFSLSFHSSLLILPLFSVFSVQVISLLT